MPSLKNSVFDFIVKSKQNGLNAVGQYLDSKARAIVSRTDRIRTEFSHAQRAPSSVNSWPTDCSGGTVFDCGANNGRNIPYYLSRGLNVVAVEANPALSAEMTDRYKGNSRVTVVNACILPESGPREIDFYINKERHYLSRLSIKASWANEYTLTRVPTTTLNDLFAEYGSPFYLKIDIEGMDGPILKSALRVEDQIPYVSAEMHSIEPFCHLVHLGYREFKFVESEFVGGAYYNLGKRHGTSGIEFSQHDAGPFGEDIPGDWMNPDQAFSYLAKTGLGWRDVHARRSPPLSVVKTGSNSEIRSSGSAR